MHDEHGQLFDRQSEKRDERLSIQPVPEADDAAAFVRPLQALTPECWLVERPGEDPILAATDLDLSLHLLGEILPLVRVAQVLRRRAQRFGEDRHALEVWAGFAGEFVGLLAHG